MWGKPTLTIQGADHMTRAGPAACRKVFPGPCPVRGHGQVHAWCSISESARPGGLGWPTQTRWLGSDGGEGAMGASSPARDGLTFLMHSAHREDTLGHPFMHTVSAFQS